MSIRRLISGGCHGLIEKAISIAKHRAANFFIFLILEAVPIGDGMQIGEKNFLSGKEETRRNPDGFQEFLTQPDETFSVKIRAGAYWYSFLCVPELKCCRSGFYPIPPCFF